MIGLDRERLTQFSGRLGRPIQLPQHLGQLYPRQRRLGRQFRGAAITLIAFFPLAFTSTCTAELCEFSDDYDLFDSHGVTVLPISVDSTASLREYRSRYELKTHLLSDFHRHVSRLYGVLNPERFYSNRSYFLVDRSGVLVWKHVESRNGDRRRNSEILSQIKRIS